MEATANDLAGQAEKLQLVGVELTLLLVAVVLTLTVVDNMFLAAEV